MKLAEGYSLEEAVNGTRILKRPGGYVLTTFGSSVRPMNIQRIAEADEKRMQATKAQIQFGLRADPETAAMFKQASREAREEYHQALEAAYRE